MLYQARSTSSHLSCRCSQYQRHILYYREFHLYHYQKKSSIITKQPGSFALLCTNSFVKFLDKPLDDKLRACFEERTTERFQN
jgi:hypothetical protein